MNYNVRFHIIRLRKKRFPKIITARFLIPKNNSFYAQTLVKMKCEILSDLELIIGVDDGTVRTIRCGITGQDISDFLQKLS